MQQRRRTTDRAACWALGATAVALIAGLAASPRARAVEANPTQSAPVPCGVIEKLSGDVQLLDASRTEMSYAVKRSSVACGGWVSIESGWAVVRHRQGYVIHLGAHTFAQFQDPKAAGKSDIDQLVLYRGQAYVEVGGGMGEFRAITANARARSARGAFLLVFNQDEEETQLVDLSQKASLENRFEASRRVALNAGEASSLNFHLLRVVPSAPRAASQASLKPKFADLHLDSHQVAVGLRAVAQREARKFASVWTSAQVSKGRRSPASYERYPHDKVSAKLKERWMRKIAGGSLDGEALLNPEMREVYHGKAGKGQVEIDDPEAHVKLKRSKEEQIEKQRLIDELSRIRTD